MSFERPIVKLKPTQIDLLADGLAWAIVIFLWLYIIIGYNKLPDVIPAHFNAKGKVTGYSSKMTIWIIPSVLTCIVLGITVLNRYPHVFNYLKPITPENAEKQYLLATRMLRYLKLSVVFIFGFIAVGTISTNKQNAGLGIWMLPLSLAFIFAPIIIYFYKANKK